MSRSKMPPELPPITPLYTAHSLSIDPIEERNEGRVGGGVLPSTGRGLLLYITVVNID